MYKEGVFRVEENLDMIKMMKAMAHDKVALEATVMNLQLQDVITNEEKLTIQLDGHISMDYQISEAERDTMNESGKVMIPKI